MSIKLQQAKLDRAVELGKQIIELTATVRNAEERLKDLKVQLLALDVLTDDPKREPDKSNLLNLFDGVIKMLKGRRTKVKDKIAEADIKALEARLEHEGHIIEQQGDPYLTVTLGSAINET